MEKVALAVLPTLVGGLFNKKDSPAPAPAAPSILPPKPSVLPPSSPVVAKPVATIDEDLRAFIADMLETMYEAHGIGKVEYKIKRFL